MVHYTGIVPAFHIKNKLEFYLHGHIAFLTAKYRQLFTTYQLLRSTPHKLIKIETSQTCHIPTYLGVLLIKIRLISVLICFIVEMWV